MRDINHPRYSHDSFFFTPFHKFQGDCDNIEDTLDTNIYKNIVPESQYDLEVIEYTGHSISDDIENIKSEHHTQNDQTKMSKTINPSIRTSTRIKRPPSWFSDFSFNVEVACNHVSPAIFSFVDLRSQPKFSKSGLFFLSNIESIYEPTTYHQTFKHIEWIKSMHDELKALEMIMTWDVVDLPRGRKPIGSKWVYKVKHNLDGTV